jgi:lipopolysaccharide export system protein LptA
MSADGAAGPADGSVLTLEGNVEFRLERAAGDPYVLRMPLLEFDSPRQIARASGPIELVADASRFTAEALEVDLNDRRLRLESVQGMKTSQLTGAVAVAVVSAGAVAQPGNSRADEEGIVARYADCGPEDCAFRELSLAGDRWRLTAGEATSERLETRLAEGEFRLTDVHFEVEGSVLDAPSGVFDFVEGNLVKAALTGEAVQFAADGATFTAQSIVFTFADEQLVTAELAGNPAAFRQPGAEGEQPASATADALLYDYRERRLRLTGQVVFELGNQVFEFCNFVYDLEAKRLRGGQPPADADAEADETPGAPVCEGQVRAFRRVPARSRDVPADDAP